MPENLPADQTAVELDLKPDTPDRVTLDTATIDGTSKLQGIGWTGGLVNSGRGSTGNTRLGAGFDFPIVRDFPSVILASPRTSNKFTCTTSVEILEAG